MENGGLDRLLTMAADLPEIPSEAVAEYRKKKSLLLDYVNNSMLAKVDVERLIGHNPREMMLNNHRNHFEFMVNVFDLNNFALMVSTLPWVYRSYTKRGFSFDYFTDVLQTWSKAVKEHLNPGNAKYINEVYKWLLRQHPHIINLAKEEKEYKFPIENTWQNIGGEYLSALLQGDHLRCIDLAGNNVKEIQDLGQFYHQVIQPAMYKVGEMWEKGEISIAQEHLASAIVSRTMAFLYVQLIPFKGIKSLKGQGVITSAPNELHELGARMAADLLELNGWDIHYLGANTPARDLIKLLVDTKPFFIGISFAMPFNIDKGREIITAIKGDAQIRETRILLGGKLFIDHPQLASVMNADGYAQCALDSIDLLQAWWDEQ